MPGDMRESPLPPPLQSGILVSGKEAFLSWFLQPATCHILTGLFSTVAWPKVARPSPGRGPEVFATSVWAGLTLALAAGVVLIHTYLIPSSCVPSHALLVSAQLLLPGEERLSHPSPGSARPQCLPSELLPRAVCQHNAPASLCVSPFGTQKHAECPSVPPWHRQWDGVSFG